MNYISNNRAKMAILGTVGIIISFFIYKNILVIHVNGRVHLTQCPISHPIEIEIKNYSFHKIIRADFLVELWQHGVSENLLNEKNRFYWTKIIPPFSSKKSCYSDAFFGTDAPSPSTNGKIDTAGLFKQARVFRNKVKGTEVYVHSANFELAD